MTCIKTGAHAYINAYGEFVYGDAFEIKGLLIMRIVESRREPIFPKLHMRIGEPDEWWDRNADGRTSTLVARDWVNLGYDGRPVEEALKR